MPNNQNARFIDRLFINPEKILFADSMGALLSALLLGLLIARQEPYFGMPESVTCTLAALALVYALYGAICYFLKAGTWRRCLKILVVANLLYSILTISIVICFYNRLTKLGLIYFLFELLVIGLLIIFEIRLLIRCSH